MQNLNIVKVSLRNMMYVIRKIIASELQKASTVVNTVPKLNTNELLSSNYIIFLLQLSSTTLFQWNNDYVLTNKKTGHRVYYLKSQVMSKLSNMI
jgi:hypothetical protein